MTDRNFKPDSGTDLVFEDAGLTDRLRIIDGGSTILYDEGGSAALTIDTSGNIEMAGNVSSVKISSSHTFSTSIPNNTLTTVFDLGSQMSDGDSATILITVSGSQLAGRSWVLKDPGGFKVDLDSQRIGYISAVGMSGDNFQVQVAISAGSHTVTGRVIILKGY